MNLDDASSVPSLHGNVLLADPSLTDPHFRRTVLFVNGHTPDDGAEGYVLNRPLGKTVGDLTLSMETPDLNQVPVFVGGPVATEHLVFATLQWQTGERKVAFSNRLSPAEASARISEGFEVRAYVGHAGWAAGQLERELKQSSWIPYLPDARILKLLPNAMWRETLEFMSPWHSLLAMTPEDPSLN